jgi:RES domain-containing protein
VIVYRASRRQRSEFDPLDELPSVARNGWRFNDAKTPILYAAGVEALSLLEVAVRPGWELVQEINVAKIEVPDGSVVTLEELGITLPNNWNARPAARDARSIAREFLAAVDDTKASGEVVCGVFVPSIISTSDFNVLLDPRQKSAFKVVEWARIPFETLRNTSTS